MYRGTAQRDTLSSRGCIVLGDRPWTLRSSRSGVRTLVGNPTTGKPVTGRQSNWTATNSYGALERGRLCHAFLCWEPSRDRWKGDFEIG